MAFVMHTILATTALTFFPCTSALEAAAKHAMMKQVTLADSLPASASKIQDGPSAACPYSENMTWASVGSDLVVAHKLFDGSRTEDAQAFQRSEAHEVKPVVLEGPQATLSESPAFYAKPLNMLTILVVLDMIRRLIMGENDEGSDANDVPLDEIQRFAKAIALNDVDTCESLVTGGMEVNVRDLSGRSPLHLAAIEGCAPMVGLLLERGAKVNASDAGGDTPLHAAACSGSRATCEVLLEYGAAVDIANATDQTPLLIAAHASLQDTCALLLRSGAGGEAGALIGAASAMGLAERSSTRAEFGRHVAEIHALQVTGISEGDQ
jgi:ankyrin repeat protein